LRIIYFLLVAVEVESVTEVVGVVTEIVGVVTEIVVGFAWNERNRSLNLENNLFLTCGGRS